LPLQNLLTDLSHLPPQTLVFYTTVFRDGAGETLVPREVVKRVSAAANAPTYGFFEQYVGQRIIGGQVNSLSEQGVEAAKVALEVLAGTAASRPQVAEIPTNKLVFDCGSCSGGELPSQSYLQVAKFGSAAANFSDHRCNLGAGCAYRLVD